MGKSKKYRGWAEAPTPLTGIAVDNHTHLPCWEGQIPNRDGVRLTLVEQLRRAAQVGIKAVITSACELPEWKPTLQLAQAFPGVYVALAIHPNEAPLHLGVVETAPDGNTYQLEEHHQKYDLDSALAQVETLARSHQESVVAIGETGLDYFRTAQAGKAAQAESFRAHIALAKELDLPLQIHDREAHADTIKILLSEGAPERTVFHCYSGDAAMSAVLAENGWWASIAGPVSYPANQWQREAALALPKELLLVETDAPYLTPAPHRGQPNASYLLPWTIRSLVQTGIFASEEAACTQLLANTTTVYGPLNTALTA